MIYTLLCSEYSDDFKTLPDFDAIQKNEPYYELIKDVRWLMKLTEGEYVAHFNLIDKYTNELEEYQRLVGIIPTGQKWNGNDRIRICPVIIYQGHNQKTQKVSLYSPYLMQILLCQRESRTCKREQKTT